MLFWFMIAAIGVLVAGYPIAAGFILAIGLWFDNESRK
jgi:hypothetical protein